MKASPLARQDGATFAEVIAAAAIFSVVVAGLAPSLLSTRSFADLGKSRSIATTLAAEKIEQIRAMAAGTPANGSDGPLNASGTATGGIFGRSWTVTPNTPIAGLSRVVTTVTWRERATIHAVRLVALVQS